MTRFYVDGSGYYIGGFDGAGALAVVPKGAAEVNGPPADARQHWNGSSFEALDPSLVEPEALTASDLAAALVGKGVLTAADLPARAQATLDSAKPT